MTAYFARFSDGSMKSIKSSKKTYTHAWRWKGANAEGIPIERMGFAGSRVLADKGAQSDSAFLTKKPRGKWGSHIGDSWKPGRLDSIEIVAVEIVE